MKRHERVFETYKRIHKGNNFEDMEKTKISKEKKRANKLKKKADRILNNTSRSMVDEASIDEFQAITFEAKKVINNSNTHKKRLKELQKNDEFK